MVAYNEISRYVAFTIWTLKAHQVVAWHDLRGSRGEGKGMGIRSRKQYVVMISTSIYDRVGHLAAL